MHVYSFLRGIFFSHPMIARCRCISAQELSFLRVDIQQLRANMGCDIKNAVIIFFMYYILIEIIKETIKKYII